MTMRLSITLEFGDGGFVMTDWADKAARKLLEKQKQKNLATERFVTEQNIKRASGPALWSDVKGKLKEHAGALREKMTADVITVQHEQLSTITIRNGMNNSRVLEVVFTPETGVVSWTCGGKPQVSWGMMITEDGGAHFQWGLVPTTPDSMAKEMLNELLEISAL